MKHLTFEEMTDFISLRSLDRSSVELIQRVNGHVCRCSECREKLRALQTVAEGVASVAASVEKNGKSDCNNVTKNKIENENLTQTRKYRKEF